MSSARSNRKKVKRSTRKVALPPGRVATKKAKRRNPRTAAPDPIARLKDYDQSYSQIYQPPAVDAEHFSTCPLVCDTITSDPALVLWSIRRHYERTGNGTDVIQGCLRAYDAGTFFQPWAVEALVDAFRKWDRFGGTKSMDSLLGLSQSRYKAIVRDTFIDQLCGDVLKLRILGGFTIEQACNMVAARLATTPPVNRTGITIKTKLSSSRIRDHYYAGGFPKLEHNDAIVAGIENVTQEIRNEFLTQFPVFEE